jgi:hypothetical protein
VCVHVRAYACLCLCSRIVNGIPLRGNVLPRQPATNAGASEKRRAESPAKHKLACQCQSSQSIHHGSSLPATRSTTRARQTSISTSVGKHSPTPPPLSAICHQVCAALSCLPSCARVCACLRVLHQLPSLPPPAQTDLLSRPGA